MNQNTVLTRAASQPTARGARRLLTLTGAAFAASLLLTGCSSSPAAAPDSTATTQEGASAAFELTDGWAKAGDGMTGVFGALTNSSDEDLTLVKVESPAARMIELHETVTSGSTSKMQEKDGGFVIPAGGTYDLEPGGDHIMFMNLPKPLLAGDEVELTLTFDDGSTVETSVLVKDYDGAQENYGDIEGSGDMENMDHGDGTDMGEMSSDEHAG